MKAARRLLFLCHSGSRNGATILLLHLLSWMKPRVDWEMDVLILGRGPIVDDFRAVATTRVLRNLDSLLCALPIAARTRWKTRLERLVLRYLLKRRRYDLVYANTAATCHLLNRIGPTSPRILCHIHELEYALRLTLDGQAGVQALTRATRVIAVSKAVRNLLVRSYAVQETRIDVINGCAPRPTHPADESQLTGRSVKDSLGWPADAFVVGGCGSMGWRKGSDLFIQIARILSTDHGLDNLFFLWVGGDDWGKEAIQFAQDARACGLENRCRQIPVTSDTARFYRAMDVFALTSREDPFPLVMLEAGAHALPIVYFSDTGGADEFVENDAGMAAPYSDTNTFADCIRLLYQSPERRRALGSTAAEKVRMRHEVDDKAREVLASIESCFSTPAPSVTAVSASPVASSVAGSIRFSQLNPKRRSAPQ